MAGASFVNPFWTTVRTQGEDRAAQPYEWRREPEDLLKHDCPACGGALRDGAKLVAVPLGPGKNKRARRAQRKGKWYEAPAIVLHRTCAGESREAAGTAAVKTSIAADTVREAATQVADRAAAHRVRPEHNPAEALVTIADHLEQTSNELSGWEEQLI